ncbi:MAG: aminopeptidase P family protein [Lachnospiraceae bacterium]|nr:aminopeptidase P family protein [Lachnospiraceae bacterium]
MFDFRSRIKRLVASFPPELDVVLISDPYSMRYYTGFTGGEGYVIVDRDEKSAVITDFRYTEMVGKECPDAKCIEIPSGKRGVEIAAETLKKMGISSVGIEEKHLTVSLMSKLQERLPDINWVSASELIAKPRAIKDEKEIELIARAEAIGDEAFSHILDFIKPGMTEIEIGLELEFTMRRLGASGLSFDTIVASGENSSMPHAGVSDRRLQAGDLVTMDFGCVYQGYCSDMTRTIAIGDLSDEQMKIYQTVWTAQALALDEIRPGMNCKDIDKVARDYIYEAGYEGCFGHGLGHSVGLFIHEEPRFSPTCDEIIRPGMVITVEPGIYISGKYGVRIEDLVVITEDGYRNLAHSEKELITIGL